MGSAGLVFTVLFSSGNLQRAKRSNSRPQPWLVPPHRRVAGPGATYLMAPFTHLSPDRPSRFTDGSYGVLYLADRFETALLETMHHHARLMARTREASGWTSQFRELVMDLGATLHDLRGDNPPVAPALIRMTTPSPNGWRLA